MLRARAVQRAAAEYAGCHRVLCREAVLPALQALRAASQPIVARTTSRRHESIINPTYNSSMRWASAGAAATTAVVADVPAALAQPLGPPLVNSTGTYPDYSITVPTIAGEGKIDWLLSWLQSPIYWLHDTGNLSWVASVAIASFALRAFTARLHFASLRGAARVQMYAPQMADYQRRLTEAKKTGDQETLQRLATEFRAFLKEKQVPNPLAIFKNIFIQMPLFIGSFFAIKRLARDAHLVPGITENVPSFLTALHVPDPTMMLPITSLALSWLAIWTNPNVVGIPSADLTPAGQRLLFSTLGGMFLFVGLKMPAILQVYLLTTTASMLIQQGMLRSKAIKGWLGFPADWPLSPERAAEMSKAQKNTFFAPFTPVFRRFSYLAEFDLKRAITGEPRIAQHVYVTKFGLRDPGVPPAPDAPLSSEANIAHSKPIQAAAAAATATTAAAAGKLTNAGLLANKPSKHRK